MLKKIVWIFLTGTCCISLFSFQTDDPAKSIKRGQTVYNNFCSTCHMANGEGMAGVYPPLAKADYLKKSSQHLISILLHGQKGEITVNDKTYNVEMPPQAHLTDEQIADVLNFVRNSWGNKGKAISPAMVKKERKKEVMD